MAIGTAWIDGAWIDAGWAAGAWSGLEAPNPIVVKATFELQPIINAKFAITIGPHIALEDGPGYILLESGDELLAEDDPTAVAAKATFNTSTTVKGNFRGV